jgi:hypothetical protein
VAELWWAVAVVPTLMAVWWAVAVVPTLMAVWWAAEPSHQREKQQVLASQYDPAHW